MFDTRQYEWADVNLNLGGRDITGIRGVKYSEKIEREPLFAKGRYPHSVQSGNVTIEGEITLLQSELESLIKAGGGSLLNLRGLTCTVSYGSLKDNATLINDVITGLYFTESPKELKQGDMNMEIAIPFLATRIDYQTQ